MNVALTALLLVVMYQATVNTRNKQKIRNLKNKVFELDQLVEMIFLKRYGKEEKEKED